MSDEQSPTLKEVAGLIAFLPGFEDRDEPFARWEGGSHDEDSKTITLSYPRYAADVTKFFQVLSESQWVQFDYMTDRTRELVSDIDKLKDASIDDIKAVLTWCSRGERFCDGLHESVLKSGVIQAALRRLSSLFPEG